jgi:hypothetical protein
MKRPLVGIAVAGFLVVAGVVFVSMQPKEESSAGSATVAPTANAAYRAPAKPAVPAASTEAVLTPQQAEERMIAIGAQQIDPAPTPDLPLEVDPESQPRSFMTESFEGLASVPPGFELTNVVLTPEGFALDPKAPATDGVREGVFVSPAKPTDFPSNAFVPMWKETVPGGTGLAVEFQLSADGAAWTEWTAVEVDQEAMDHRSATMPDGSPNVNAEYVLGGLHAWPVDQWTQVRYRVTMQSQTEASPVVGGFRIYHMDSTMGEGRLAEISTAGPASPEEAPTVTP